MSALRSKLANLSGDEDGRVDNGDERKSSSRLGCSVGMSSSLPSLSEMMVGKPIW